VSCAALASCEERIDKLQDRVNALEKKFQVVLPHRQMYNDSFHNYLSENGMKCACKRFLHRWCFV